MKKCQTTSADLTMCPGCGWRYEFELIQPLTYPDGSRSPLCPVCALAARNRIHGTRFTSFTGEAAQNLLEDALDWRADHPECKP